MKTQWIEINTRLPRIGREVLVCWKDLRGKKRISTATRWKNTYEGAGWHFSYHDCDGTNMLDDSQVVKWMPLPKK